jgi:cell division protease FtsH
VAISPKVKLFNRVNNGGKRMSWLILIFVILVLIPGIRWLVKRYGAGLKMIFQELLRREKFLTIFILVVFVGLIGYGGWLGYTIYHTPTPEEEYEIAFVEEVLPNRNEFISLRDLQDKLDVHQVEVAYYQWVEKEYTTKIKWFLKFKGEDGYYLVYTMGTYLVPVKTFLGKDYIPLVNYLVDYEKIHVYDMTTQPKPPFSTATWAVPLGVILVLIVGIGIFWQRYIGASEKFIGKCRARFATEKVTFDDVAGIEEAKNDLLEVVEMGSNPQKFKVMGAKIPKGVLLVGPPGCGKTMLARAMANEIGASFYAISGSEFVEMFVGVGARRIRDFFGELKKEVKRTGRAVGFIDEIDALIAKRGARVSGSDDERHSTTNQLMVEMDGFEPGTGITIIAATNREDILDPAATRPGRFDRRIFVNRPSLLEREAILRVHTKDKPVAGDVDLGELARSIPLGSSGADLANIVNEAAIHAVMENKGKIDKECFQYAKDKIMFGPERKSVVVTDEEKKICAYHESGHALIAKLLPHIPPLNRVSIVPRGETHGFVQTLPERDRYIKTRGEILEEIAVYVGSRAAEEEVFGFDGISTGAAKDLEVATQLAMGMVSVYGMSEEMGLVSLKALAETGQSMQAIDEKVIETVNKIVISARDRGIGLVRENRESLEALAKVLLRIEDIKEGEVAIEILEDEKLVKRILKAEGRKLDRIIEATEKKVLKRKSKKG